MPGLCRPIHEGGIGFDFRLAMGIPDYWIKLLKEKKDENWDIQEMWQVLSDRLPDVGTIAYAESHDQALVGDKTIAFRIMDREMYGKMGVHEESPIIDRGLALHKMLRLFTISLGGQAYLNFMGNEFGHPEWIDFPREGNGWSHKYARRQWSLSDRQDLKYRFLNQFDIHMLRFVKEYGVLNGNYGTLLFMDDWHKTVVFEKMGLVFVFNFHVNQSAPGYRIPVLQEGTYRSVLSTDNPLFGGHGRFDESIDYPTFRDKDGDVFLKMYNPNRTAIVLKPSA
jgi:1,4-alpha-glucan branching enzyme